MLEHICRFNQIGFCKFKSECEKVHENKICRANNCDPRRCSKRHPKDCRNYSKHRFCNFAYLHSEMVVKEDFERVTEEMKNLKAEMDILKNTVKTLSEIKQEKKVLKKNIEKLNKDIIKMKTEN